MNMINKLIFLATEYDRGDAKRIQHFMKVHAYSKLIGETENLEEKTQFIVEAAAIFHDIGIHEAQEKFGRCDGKLQEKLGPEIAEKILREVGLADDEIERICFLIAHHHTYTDVQGIDWQILLEADFLVNAYEDNLSIDACVKGKNNFFKTYAGTKILETMFDFNKLN